jgi:SAM-dependent methyltransferase
MRNAAKWRPSKYIYKKGRLSASENSREVAVASRLMADRVAHTYDTYLKVYARGKLIDMGCGKVPLFAAYRSLVSSNVCIDWNQGPHGGEHLDIECDLSTSLPFKDGEFDTIILSDVLEHIAQPQCLWQEMRRILSNNGRILLNVPFFYWLHETPHDYYRYTEFALRRFAESSGFEVLVLESIGGAPEVVTDIVAKSARHVPTLGSVIAVLVQWIAGVFLRTKIGKRVSETTKRDFPLGYILIAEKVALQQG